MLQGQSLEWLKSIHIIVNSAGKCLIKATGCKPFLHNYHNVNSVIFTILLGCFSCVPLWVRLELARLTTSRNLDRSVRTRYLQTGLNKNKGYCQITRIVVFNDSHTWIEGLRRPASLPCHLVDVKDISTNVYIFMLRVLCLFSLVQSTSCRNPLMWYFLAAGDNETVSLNRVR